MSEILKTWRGWDDLLKAQENGVVIGLGGVTGVVSRLDIDELLLTKPDTFNLFLLALRALQEDPDAKNPMGYFQIAGIHGLPKTKWNGVPEPHKTFYNEEQKDRYGSGYCVHGEITFPTWHRPYLAMMEQTLFVKMVEIAQTFADSERYLEAARDFRLPFWDYYVPRGYETVFPGVTMGRDETNGQLLNLEHLTFTDKATGKQIKAADLEVKTAKADKDGNLHSVELLVSTKYPYDFGIPQIFMLEKVMIHLPPHGKVKLDQNPLRTFWFPNNYEIPESHWKSMGMKRDEFSRGHTVRHLLFGYKSPFQGANIRMNHILNKDRDNGVSLILNLIANDQGYDDYKLFSTTKDFKPRARSGSLEALHNSYHNNIGGSGHMSEVPVAAFDPVFWMHHANIDRYLAIWQATHPDGWKDPETKKLKEDLKSLKDDLRPFYKKDKTFWTSLDAEDTKVFGYTYEDVQQTCEETKKLFRHRHAWSIRPKVPPKDWKPTAPTEMEPLDLSSAQVYVNHPEYLRPTPPPEDKDPGNTSATPKKSYAYKNTDDSGPEDLKSKHDHQMPNVKTTNINRREWFVDDVVERLQLNGSFSIDYFIGLKGGAINVLPQDYSLAPTLAGSTYIFSSPREVCENCQIQQEDGHLVCDTTPITPILMDYIKIGQLVSLEPEHVKPFLTDRLKWRVQTASGRTVDPRDIPSLKISISSKVSSVPVDTEPPVIEKYPEIIEEIKSKASKEAEHTVGTSH